jgi:hypothetical protein
MQTIQLTTETLSAAIEKVMKDTGCAKLEAITALQAASVQIGNEQVLQMLCDIKWKLIEA